MSSAHFTSGLGWPEELTSSVPTVRPAERARTETPTTDGGAVGWPAPSAAAIRRAERAAPEEENRSSASGSERTEDGPMVDETSAGVASATGVPGNAEAPALGGETTGPAAVWSDRATPWRRTSDGGATVETDANRDGATVGTIDGAAIASEEPSSGLSGGGLRQDARAYAGAYARRERVGESFAVARGGRWDSESEATPSVDGDGAARHTSAGSDTSGSAGGEIADRPSDQATEADDDASYGRHAAARPVAPELGGDPLAPPPRTRVMVVANQKGGVGKTTTAVNLAAGLAQYDLRVLVIDLDPQGNASTALGVDHREDVAGVYEVLVDGHALSGVVSEVPGFPRLDCIPATIQLAGAEIELVSLVARESRLKRALDVFLAEREGAGDRYDYVLIDCPPSLGLLTLNALVAGQELLIPIQCEYYALEGVTQLLRTVELVQSHLNPEVEVSTVVLTMYDGRTRLAAGVAEDVRENFRGTVLKTAIPRSVRISEAPSYGQTVITHDPVSSGAMTYLEAARELAYHGSAAPSRSDGVGAGAPQPDGSADAVASEDTAEASATTTAAGDAGPRLTETTTDGPAPGMEHPAEDVVSRETLRESQ